MDVTEREMRMVELLLPKGVIAVGHRKEFKVKPR
jgi:hypothetical protein